MNWVAAQGQFHYENQYILHTDLRRAFGAGDLKSKRVLDTGTGPGPTAFAYARLGASEVIGVDRSAPHVRFCRGLQQYRATVPHATVKETSLHIIVISLVTWSVRRR